jgi:hypothetical protein
MPGIKPGMTVERPTQRRLQQPRIAWNCRISLSNRVSQELCGWCEFVASRVHCRLAADPSSDRNGAEPVFVTGDDYAGAERNQPQAT